MQPSFGLTSGIHRQQQQQQQQFVEDDCCCFSVLPISHPPPNLNHSFQPQQEKHPSQHHHHHHHRHHHYHQQQMLFPQQQQQQQLFQHQQFFPFQQRQEERLNQQGQVLTVAFKLGLNGNSGSKGSAALDPEQGATFFYGNEHNNDLVMPNSWVPHQDSATIKEPFWKPLDGSIDRKRREDDEMGVQRSKKINYNPWNVQNLESKYRLFGELEALCSLAKIGETNQTAGSGSALTGDNSPENAGLSMPFGGTNHGPSVDGAVDVVNTAVGVDHGSENSIGEEASLRKSQRRKRRRKVEEKLGSIAGFFEDLVKRVMEHQEMLHRRFLEVIERMDKERRVKEEEWRRQEAAKLNREAIARAHEQALASGREAQILNCIEKITGQSINLPQRKTPLSLQQEFSKAFVEDFTPVKTEKHCRWPKAEVEALIQARTSIETKFQEPGLKGPLWEEVSSLMASMAYQRTAKMCKEKWENINKYFKKARENTKKRSQQSKTCSYFSQLDDLYSRTPVTNPVATTSVPLSSSEVAAEKQGCSELLEVFLRGRDPETARSPSSENIKNGQRSSRQDKEDREFDHAKDGKEEPKFVGGGAVDDKEIGDEG